MRVISGSLRGRRLEAPSGMTTRPTTDKVKESLFSSIQFELPGAYVLDLFAGSGQLGLEAISRGAARCTFVEQAKNAAACIEDNLKFTKLADKAQVRKFDAVSFVSSLPEIDYDVIFMDPPYSKGLERRVLEVLSTKKFMTDTLIVVEAALDEDFSYVDALGFEITKDKHYKTNKHVFLMQKENV